MANPYREQIIALVTKKPSTYTYAEVGAQFNMTDEQVRAVARANSITGLFIKNPGRSGIITSSTLKKESVMGKLSNQEVSALILQETRTDAEREKRSDAERKLKVLKRDYRELEMKYQDVIEYSEREKRPIHILPAAKGEVNEISPQIIFSDWHAEEKVDPKTIGGKNRYTLDIATKRAANVTNNAIKRMRELSDEGVIKTVGLYLLGDFITGHIHDENVETAQLGRLDALQFVEELLLGSIERLLAETDYDYVIYCKVGNHSRMTQKVRAATEWQNSVEPLMYWSLKRTLQTKYGERVRFHLEPSYTSVVNVLGTRVRYHHGHAVSYGGGVGGLHIPLRKKIKNWNETMKADVDFMGHYHSFLEHATFKYVVNGSLIGYNAYADRLGVPMEAPLQAMCVIHKKYGVVRILPLYAE